MGGQEKYSSVDEQVLVRRLVLDCDGNVLVAVLGDSEDGLNLGAGEHLDNFAGEAGEVTVLELEGAVLVGGSELWTANADLIQLRHLNQTFGVGQSQVVPQHR